MICGSGSSRFCCAESCMYCTLASQWEQLFRYATRIRHALLCWAGRCRPAGPVALHHRVFPYQALKKRGLHTGLHRSTGARPSSKHHLITNRHCAPLTYIVADGNRKDATQQQHRDTGLASTAGRREAIAWHTAPAGPCPVRKSIRHLRSVPQIGLPPHPAPTTPVTVGQREGTRSRPAVGQIAERSALPRVPALGPLQVGDAFRYR